MAHGCPEVLWRKVCPLAGRGLHCSSQYTAYRMELAAGSDFVGFSVAGGAFRKHPPVVHLGSHGNSNRSADSIAGTTWALQAGLAAGRGRRCLGWLSAATLSSKRCAQG